MTNPGSPGATSSRRAPTTGRSSYLREPQIPGFYLVALALIALASAALIRLSGASFVAMRGYPDLFFMGAAFLLLETKSVVQFALLFGTTWFVNALVFIGVLASVYVAIETAMRVRLPRPTILYAPPRRFGPARDPGAGGPPPVAALRGTVRRGRWCSGSRPIFIANLVFAQRFRDVGEANVAFGANLLGAVLGGLLEYAALVTGYAALALLVALLYGAAFFAGRRYVGRQRASSRHGMTARRAAQPRAARIGGRVLIAVAAGFWRR